MTVDDSRRTAVDNDGIAEFADEMRLLAEVVLERIEPALRHAAAEGKPEWSNCNWCPVCAAAALVRGERHEVVAALAEHGTAIVTVLREALAGVPVDPVMPHQHSGSGDPHQRSSNAVPEDQEPDGTDSATGPGATAPNDAPGSDERARVADETSSAAADSSGQAAETAPPRRRSARLGFGRGKRARSNSPGTPSPAADGSPAHDPSDTPPDPAVDAAAGSPADAPDPAGSRAARGEHKRARYVGIPVTIKG
ncbi:hypothetical protein [Nocardia donostiensis]|uniref:hypothetical protein n=1 Tax=Nocardia donostiensis TaxID=1538463 RepID=UPI001FE56DA9|nr:hypothetical protein [Nocardia donostiensis]